MTSLILGSDLSRHTGGVSQLEISARCYRDLLEELQQRFPELDSNSFEKMAIAIDGVIINEPLLQTFGDDSELVLVPRIAAG